MSSKSTATKENALTDEERDAYLARQLMGRMATQRPDGWAHVTPIWYCGMPRTASSATPSAPAASTSSTWRRTPR